MKEMAKFHAPVIQENPSGWGPCAVPDKFKDMPYQPFSKGDRLGKVADWTGATYQDKRYTNKYSSQFGGGSQYAYFHEEDETSFQLVDTAKTQKTAYQRNRMRFAQRNLRRDKDRRTLTQFNMQTLPKSAKQKERDRMRLQKKFQKQFGVRQKWDQKSQTQLKPRDSSVEVRSDWEVKEEMDFPRLMKMRYMDVEDPTDIESCGALEHYEKAFDRVTTRNEKPLKSIKRIFHTVTTTDDPVIRKLAKTQGNVFATDAILATLMCCTRSVNSWDIIVQRVGNKLFFDKRDNSDFDLLTVSETANEPPQDEGSSLNSPRNLAMEATYINHNFSQQCLKMGGERHKFPNPNPFVEEDIEKSEVASVAYRYRRWQLGEDIDLIVRCEHDGVMTGANGEMSFINVKTLNEWDSRYCNGVDWRQKLDSQRGAVLATELKNNSYKLARWTCCAILAGSEYLKLGYVSRYHVKDSSRHVVLGTQQFKPNEFASQINLSMENAWGILRCVIDICRKLEEGKYLILKDPNKQVIRVYSLPDGTFSSDEDEEEEEEDEEEDEEGQGLHFSDWPTLKLVMIGVREAGKSAAGNAILGKKAFDEVGVKTKVSVSCQGLGQGMKLMVVDTPGWEWFNVRGTSASTWTLKEEIIRSMSLCQPGAHALLLVVPLSFSFSKSERCAIEEHVQLFGPEAWNYSLVLFTIQDRKQLRGSSVKQAVVENEELHMLVEKCRGRFHTLYSTPQPGDNQVANLLTKIKNIVASNGDVVLSSEKILKWAQESEI
ncbi:Eukaryotic translation initiation factor 3 subunit D [Triplophysa tibetana]|uniref:Eukaryotic translation initiation factor 3 subunit D n=1 Tax=Triplophysa tibetana TaxID=1572043 RepID=A0A5A9N7Q7_9TELE|nr:Eukaryotic translation initiation factor 3 subunit D [Triplophysa tibetana]